MNMPRPIIKVEREESIPTQAPLPGWSIQFVTRSWRYSFRLFIEGNRIEVVDLRARYAGVLRPLDCDAPTHAEQEAMVLTYLNAPMPTNGRDLSRQDRILQGIKPTHVLDASARTREEALMGLQADWSRSVGVGAGGGV
jgi:hypothetical protein